MVGETVYLNLNLITIIKQSFILGCVQIKIEEDYDQVMVEEHLSSDDDASDLTGSPSVESVNVQSKSTWIKPFSVQ